MNELTDWLLVSSALNILDPVCGGDTSLACCNAPQVSWSVLLCGVLFG